MTTVKSDKVTLFFETNDNASLLNTALAEGHSTAESKPVPTPGTQLADTRILKSDTINIRMRAGGQEIECIDTPSAASIEFIPNRPEEPHRWVTGDRVSIGYREKNQIQSFRSYNVATRTEKPKPKDAKDAPPPELTWSKDMSATFNPTPPRLTSSSNGAIFGMRKGRRAKADRASLEQPNNVMLLNGAARVWDSTGSADADKITMDEKSGDFSAEGNVSSTRMPDKKKDSNANGGGMLSEDEPLHARAKKMRSSGHN